MFKIAIVGVRDAALLQDHLLTDLWERLSFVKLFNGRLQVLQAEDEHGNVVKRAARSGLAQCNFNTFGRCNVLVIVKLLLGTRAIDFAFVADGMIG